MIFYKILYSKESEKFLKKHKKEGLNFLKAFKEISENDLNSTRYDIVIYKGYKDHFRLRIGTYRAIFEVNQDIITIKVIKIGSRGDIYK